MRASELPSQTWVNKAFLVEIGLIGKKGLADVQYPQFPLLIKLHEDVQTNLIDLYMRYNDLQKYAGQVSDNVCTMQENSADPIV